MSKRYTTILSIAGSDSIGGAGIQADIKTACAHGVYAMTAITAVTAQNTRGVDSYEPVGGELLKAQLKAILSDVRPDAVKIGMVPSAEAVKVIAEQIGRHKLRNVVVDPVMVSTSGSDLSTDESVEAMRTLLFPKADLVTPNVNEASRLAGIKIEGSVQMMLAAMGIINSGQCAAVLVKSGDLRIDSDRTADILSRRGKQPVEIVHRRVSTRNTHGTGCSLSTAIACNLAQGMEMEQAVRRAIDWITRAIEAGKEYRLGKGRGPINHFVRADMPDDSKEMTI